MLGILFTFIGVMLFLDTILMSVGNVLFLGGILLVIGPKRTKEFFFSRAKLKGSVTFFVGIILVLARRPILGILLESFGFINLFGYGMSLVTTSLLYCAILHQHGAGISFLSSSDLHAQCRCWEAS